MEGINRKKLTRHVVVSAIHGFCYAFLTFGLNFSHSALYELEDMIWALEMKTSSPSHVRRFHLVTLPCVLKMLGLGFRESLPR